MTGCIVFGSEIAPTTMFPPSTGVSVPFADAVAAAGPVLVGELQETATNMAAPRTATSRRMRYLPPVAQLLYQAIPLEYAAD